ncbi:MAG: hypothetical protein M0016_03295 [Deltaproteobacteria bacterium]|jgi:hypothetical protein|nr:hypothetical protein [Deltaproteobacteria bacterium]MCL5879744.1 hypothetical protein [Deltaproteobacteria bacterium]MDA8304173.1 hypothetical protein [Deltaproteobacteria bacterium]
MSSLKTIEKKYFRDLLGSESGYVLDFTNATFAEFFRDNVDIDIYDNKYSTYGDSKGKRLNAFWDIESDQSVGKILDELLKVWKYEQNKKGLSANTQEYNECKKIVNKLLGKKVQDELKEDDFLNQEFLNLDLSLLYLDIQFETIIKQRIEEIKKCLGSGASLSVIFLCGSILEGLLQDRASKNIQKFNTSKSAPKDYNEKVRQLHEWTLDSLINVAHEVGLIELDIKKYSHDLKDFRNYIHPRQQALQGFNPDKHTAEISWKVLQATIASLSGQRR